MSLKPYYLNQLMISAGIFKGIVEVKIMLVANLIPSDQSGIEKLNNV